MKCFRRRLEKISYTYIVKTKYYVRSSRIVISYINKEEG